MWCATFTPILTAKLTQEADQRREEEERRQIEAALQEEEQEAARTLLDPTFPPLALRSILVSLFCND